MERKDVPCHWVARAEVEMPRAQAMCDVGPQLRVRCPPVCSHADEQNTDPALGQAEGTSVLLQGRDSGQRGTLRAVRG